MTLPQTFGFAAMLVGLSMYSAKLCVDGEVTDVLTLVCLALAVGYIGHML